MTPILLAAALAGAPAPTLPEGEALTAAVAARSAALFETAFEQCDPEAFRRFAVDDLEFYHDIEGVAARSADEFVADYARNCTRRGASWRPGTIASGRCPVSARSRKASICSTSGRARGPNASSAARASSICGG